jgi:hypothetical protein
LTVNVKLPGRQPSASVLDWSLILQYSLHQARLCMVGTNHRLFLASPLYVGCMRPVTDDSSQKPTQNRVHRNGGAPAHRKWSAQETLQRNKCAILVHIHAQITIFQGRFTGCNTVPDGAITTVLI